ncbi:MAG: alpha/beta fold hydrolase [Acidobacteriia bacterium]|nr:alpha/beta fold hydrolase [Terriglobia bacterium]
MLLRFCGAGGLIPLLLVAQSYPDATAISRKAMGLLLAGRYSDLEDMFTPEMRAQLTGDLLRSEIGPRIRSLGAVEKIGEAVVQPAGQFTVAVVSVRFSSGSIDWRFSVNKDGKIAGLFFQPAEGSQAAEWQRPAYSRPDSFHEREVTVGDGWKLPGTLTVPNGNGGAVPGVVLVHGSGPLDRDETIGANKPFRDLAEGLASRGIAVLRYDKRTKVYTARLAEAKDLTLQQETVEDAAKAAALLRAQPEVASSRVFVLGHSLGGYAAPRIAQQDSRLAGLILMAANVRPLEDLLQDQLKTIGLAGPDLEKAKTDVMRSLPESYSNDLKNYDPAELARQLFIPMLILQGERDYQVTMKDFELWRAALVGRGNVTFRSFPTLNHLFEAGQAKSTPAEYALPGHVDVEVVDQIATWVRRVR